MTEPTAPDLATRDGLPDHLRILADRFARADWDGHEAFGALTRFWLDRHLMFRRLLATLDGEGGAFLDGEIDYQRYQAGLARYGSLFVGQLHEHHHVEDDHYFPQLVALEPRLSAGFDLLDADHHALDAHLEAFTNDANGILRPNGATKEAVDAFLKTLERSKALLDRHLSDEEDLIVPIILAHGEGSLR